MLYPCSQKGQQRGRAPGHRPGGWSPGELAVGRRCRPWVSATPAVYVSARMSFTLQGAWHCGDHSQGLLGWSSRSSSAGARRHAVKVEVFLVSCACADNAAHCLGLCTPDWIQQPAPVQGPLLRQAAGTYLVVHRHVHTMPAAVALSMLAAPPRGSCAAVVCDSFVRMTAHWASVCR